MMAGSETREWAQDALQRLADGVTLVNEEARIVFLNPCAIELFGLNEGEWLGRDIADLYREIARQSEEHDTLAPRMEQAAARAPETPRLEFAVRAPHARIVEAKWFALQGQRAYGVLWRDVTHDKQVDTLTSQVLSTVSHELKTPLSSIKGFATTLLRRDVRWDEATQREFLQIIEDESNRLEELIDDLLDMSQMEAGALRIHPEPTQLKRLVRDAVEQAQRRTEAHWFVMDLPAELPRVWADPRRIRQVLNNLVDNAVKYAPAGGQITLTCEVEGDYVNVTVADQGQGIPREYLDRIFERFFQVDGASTRQTGGSGLGLAIARGIVEAHGGKIRAESDKGQGTVLRFSLPIVKDSDLLQNQDES